MEIFKKGERMKNTSNLSQETLDVISTYMNDDIREDLHFRLAPYEPIIFYKNIVREIQNL